MNWAVLVTCAIAGTSAIYYVVRARKVYRGVESFSTMIES
jgi:hypothetical protein